MKLIFSQTITLANAQPIKVTLGEDTQVLDEVVAVSYTHLDVYKRQPLSISLKL